ncbi:FkbM family methyltransferase [Demetria terragena]|uniref:FkbM family methyltransferase n=1 Tax=Demetria terragena TaxID=63959 RepID=UPI0012EA70B2|nr:FkbM family methyltransferase [Demetria terragena]
MKVSGRSATSGQDIRRRWSAPLRPRNYRAAFNSLRVYAQPVDGLRRYALGQGQFPHDLSLRTPLGRVTVHLPHAHDMRTVNEVFCRGDYGRDAPAVVLDIGANIGVSALYFLTRRPDAVVHCVEPHPGNLAVLRANLAPFSDRVQIHPQAVAPTAGRAEFVADPVGRYSGLADFTPRESGEVIVVPTRAIDEVVSTVAGQCGRIELLKVDTEGSEPALLRAMGSESRAVIDSVVWEDEGHVRRERWTR